jgi:hypothetical protein
MPKTILIRQSNSGREELAELPPSISHICYFLPHDCWFATGSDGTMFKIDNHGKVEEWITSQVHQGCLRHMLQQFFCFCSELPGRGFRICSEQRKLLPAYRNKRNP